MTIEQPRVAVITGAAGGIGRAIAERLGKQGHRIVLLDVAQAVHTAGAQLRDLGVEAKAVQMDITDADQVDRLPEQLGDWWQGVAVLINNAGISPKTNGSKSPVKDMALEEWNRVMQVNLTGMFLVTKKCLSIMCEHTWGRIVMVASQAARTRTVVPGAHYQATKAGMVGFARVLAAEVAPFGITVNSVAPGRVESDMTAAVSADTNAGIAGAIPAGRMGKPQEVAAAVAYLVSPDSSYCTGAIIDVNGGSFMP